ncbi:MAG: hypothetical protein KF841_02700 [Phycisphaerae bacterium]|nr:hypothetical protein [Phycisphaerae bacterium]
MTKSSDNRTRRAAMTFIAFAIAPLAMAQAQPVTPLPTTIENFFLRGTQPLHLEPDNEIVPASEDCAFCHANAAPIYDEWRGTLMAQAARDPVFYACLDIVEHDAPGAGDACIRCHAPKAWLEGRSTPTNGAAITAQDRDGITCNFCHRLVDPFDSNYSATELDAFVLNDLGSDRPVQSFDLGTPSQPGFGGSGSYVIDPFDRRRGPFPVATEGNNPPNAAFCNDFHWAVTYPKCESDFGTPDGCPTFESPFHRSSELCATCHDVSFPHVSYNAQGQAVFNGSGVAHPDGNKYNMAPEQRTFSEWLKSEFAQPGGVDMGGRFGAEGQLSVSSCQDCHMPRRSAQPCISPSVRPDVPNHSFFGAATWVLDAIALHYGPEGPIAGFPLFPDSQEFCEGDIHEFCGETAQAVRNSGSRNRQFLTRAADLEAYVDDEHTPGESTLRIRVINQTGHKLPTGYIEGRRIFLTVEYFDCSGSEEPIAVFGQYDAATATLDHSTTKVYHAEMGPDEGIAAAVNLPAAPSAHSAFAVKRFYDNRIPPRGFNNAEFSAIQAQPVGYDYADGQYWDDTWFQIPQGAVAARVSLYYQQTTREYIEFLRDNNPQAQSNPTNRGELAYALWTAAGKSAPVLMARLGADAPFDLNDLPGGGDTNCDGLVNADDIPAFVDALLGLTKSRHVLRAADLDRIDGPDGADIQIFVNLLLGN